MRYFLKVYNGAPLFDADGAVIPTVQVNEMLHSIVTDEAPALKALDKFLKTNSGGVSEITKSELEDLKKKAAILKASPPDTLGGLRPAPDTTTPSHRAGRDVVEVGDSMLPIEDEIKAIKAKHNIEDKAEKAEKKEAPTPVVVGHRRATPHDPS